MPAFAFLIAQAPPSASISHPFRDPVQPHPPLSVAALCRSRSSSCSSLACWRIFLDIALICGGAGAGKAPAVRAGRVAVAGIVGDSCRVVGPLAIANSVPKMVVDAGRTVNGIIPTMPPTDPLPVRVLRRAALADGRPSRELAAAAGIDHTSLTRFMLGERGLSFLSAARLMAALGLHVVRRRRA